MSATIMLGGRAVEARPGETIASAMRSAGMIADAFLFLMDGRPVPMDTVLAEGASVKALKVASGG
ncbi:MAG: (2Fe-2S)-binding protein [Candidatus Methanoplasma sp.]|nr:(2Fe-2S)-binding protein [Candidatus Methanoplasma sp.]